MLPLFAARSKDASGAINVVYRQAAIPQSYAKEGLGGWVNAPDGIGTDGFGYVTTAPAAVPSTARREQGLAFTPDGALYITTDAPSPSSAKVCGIAVRQDGAVHVVAYTSGVGARVNGIALSATGQVLIYSLADFVATLSPAAWYQYGVGISSSGGLVSAWADQSGNARDLLQASSTNQPALDSDNSILFDGVDNFMATGAFTLNQPETIYLLCNPTTFTVADSLIDGGASAGGKLRQGSITPQLLLNAGSTTADLAALPLGQYGVVAAVINGASSGISVNQGAFTTGDAGVNNMGGITLGAGGGGGLQWLNGAFKEAIIFPAAHDAATRARVISYLMQVGAL